ncbi:hypothetical protein, partial [uncultured Treponema sp.]|uniref:hypothetical protein n=1 Tax=uncultured Treponema sp. TaxID=162155 RepID=UPI00280C28D1
NVKISLIFFCFLEHIHRQTVRSAVAASGRLHSSAHKPCSKPANCTNFQGQTKPNPHQTRSLRNGSAAAPARAKFFGKTDNVRVVLPVFRNVHSERPLCFSSVRKPAGGIYSIF